MKTALKQLKALNCKFKARHTQKNPESIIQGNILKEHENYSKNLHEEDGICVQSWFSKLQIKAPVLNNSTEEKLKASQ